MKLFRYILTIAAAAAMFGACGPDPEPPFDPQYATDIESSTLRLSNNMDGQKVVNITSNMKWKVEYNSDWLHIAPTSGENNGSITATFENNLSEDDLRTKVYIVFYHKEEEKGRLTYDFLLPGIDYPGQLETDLTGETITLSKVQPGLIMINITSNLDWTITDDAQWLNFISEKGSGNGTVTCYFNHNDSLEEKSTTVVFSGSYNGNEKKRLEYEFILPVRGVIDTDITGSSLTLPAIQPGEVDIKVSTDLNWRIEYPESVDWLSFSPASGNSTTDVKCSFGENNTYQSISTRVAFIATEDGKELRLEYDFVLPPKFTGRLSTDIAGESVALSDLQPYDFNINVDSNMEWTIGSDAEWLTFTPSGFAGSGTVKCSVGENNSGGELRSTVTIIGNFHGKEYARLEYEFILPPKDTFEPILMTDIQNRIKTLPEEQPGTFDIQLTSNMEWVIENSVMWLGFDSVIGQGNATIECRFDKNSTDNDKRAFVNIIGYQPMPGTPEGKRERARLTYEFILPAFKWSFQTNLGADGETITLPAEQPGSGSIELSTNLDWTISNGAMWLSFDPASGSGSTTITYEWGTNKFNYPLEYTVTLTGTHPNLTQPKTLKYKFVLPPAAPQLETDLPHGTVTLPVEQPGTMEIAVTSNLEWEIRNGAPDWLTFTPSEGTENGTVECSFIENTTGRTLDTQVVFIGKRPGGTEEVGRVEYQFVLPVPETAEP